VIEIEKCGPVEWAMTLPPCYISKFRLEADDQGAWHVVMVGMRKGDIAFNIRRAVSMGLATVIIEVVKVGNLKV
jgi:hypothetical protein